MKQKIEGFTGVTGAALPEVGTDARAGAHRPTFREGGEVASASVPLHLPGGDSGGGAAAPRLEKRTYLDARYQITSRNYGNGLAEVGWSFVSSIIPPKAQKGESTQRLDNEDRAVRRAKSRLRQLILAGNLTHLLTLTYRENVTDFIRAKDDLSRFIRKVRRHIPDWDFVAVAEQQERGAWHWHIAVRGRQNVELVRRLWREVVGEGNIDVSAPKGSRIDQRLYLVKYLGKYLVKAFAIGQRNLNAHRFRASRRIKVPTERFSFPIEPGMKPEDIALQQLRDSAGKVGFVWNSADRLCGCAYSWK